MRGVEAPFQLLVSMFTLALVLALAYYVLQHASTQKCEDAWDAGLARFSLVLQNISESAPPSSDVLEFPGRCGDYREGTLSIMAVQGEGSCTLYCGEPVDMCYVVKFVVTSTRGHTVYTGDDCLRISNYAYAHLVNDCPSGYTSIVDDLKGSGYVVTKNVERMLVRRTRDGISVCVR